MCLSVHACDHFFFFNDTATTEIYTLSLHDALPICGAGSGVCRAAGSIARSATSIATNESALTAKHVATPTTAITTPASAGPTDRKSTRLNSSHANISYAVFCLKKNKYRLLLENHSH